MAYLSWPYREIANSTIGSRHIQGSQYDKVKPYVVYIGDIFCHLFVSNESQNVNIYS